MTARIIDGKQVAAGIRAELKDEVAKLKARGVTPGLGVILVGDDPASVSYVTGKERACDEVGIYSDHNRLTAETSQADLKRVIDRLNADPRIHGILVQLPLPRHLKESEAIFAIDPSKDVDGIHPVSVGKMVTGERAFLSCTPHGVLQLLLRSGVKIEGSHVVIVGRSNLVGRPLANMLIQKKPTGNATVTICHTRTKDLGRYTRQADILVAAVGQPGTITADMVRDGAVVIDVGVTRVEDATRQKGFRLVGDVDFEAVKEKASLITPVPGGVGPMTITMLLYNTVESAKQTAAAVDGD
jgi:methylenetetrahydrofolate dehydrogenase (NADP+)/methenyltetrahydrofolate cyclohydrolase